MARRTLTDNAIENLRAKSKRYAVPDPRLPGHYVRVTPTGAKSFAAVARAPSGKQVWHTIGSCELHKIEDARELARIAILVIKAGGDRSGPQSFESVAELWFKRHVEGKGLRSASHIRIYLDKHLLPVWAGREFTSIRRGDITALLDTVEDNSGPVAADKVLALAGNIMGWYATRHDDYNSPVIKGAPQ